MSNDPTKQQLPPPGQEPPTRPVPQWPKTPPPPPGSPAPRQDPAPQQDRQDSPQNAPTARIPVEQPTGLDAAQASAAPPTQWDQPTQRAAPTLHDRAQPTQWERPQYQQTQAPQEPQDRTAAQWSPQPPQQQPPAGAPLQPRRPPKRRRVRRSVMALFTVIVLLILLVIGDRVALAVTENQFASSFQQNGLPVKPSVTIEGFPFLTQLAAKDFNKVDISASNVPVPLPTGGNLSITSVKATINGLHISSYSSTASARVDHMNATVFVSFSALAAAGGIGDGTGVTFSPVNANTVKVTASLAGVISDSEEVQITVTGPQTISIKALSSGGGALGSVLSSFGSYSFNLPKGVPPTLKITNVSLNSQGVTASASATNATFSQS